jgi:AbrB family looped-hinge helix DNA binding protein
MRTTVTSNGRIFLAAELRDRDGIRAGQQFAIERIVAGEYLLKKVPVSENAGLTDWLLSCPEKDWFRPLKPTS